MFQDVFILGVRGRLGSTLLNQIFEKDDTNCKIHSNPTRIVGLASSSDFIYNRLGLDKATCFYFLDKVRRGFNQRSLDNILNHVVTNGEKTNTIFIDVTNSKEPMAKFHQRVINETKHGIVTANKNPLTLIDYDKFKQITKQVKRYGYRCTVMAGAEAVDKIRDLRDLGEPIERIDGCFSGTINYITSQIQTGKAFSDVVKNAINKGYTEPNPADDLSGEDVAKKILILARTAGYDLNMDDISLQPLVPSEYLQENNINDFLENLKILNKDFSEKVRSAKDSKRVLRYVASLKLVMNSPRLEVSLKEVARDSSLHDLQGNLNKITIYTPTHNPEGYSVIAKGAGKEITALNIRRDLLNQLEYRIGN